ncbi:MAG TPA: hypothetical protein VK604_05135 [Bryobacteraceae bacterium]|nr:hypothetical protein [Bryobacteraceae bacterium]
MTALIRPPGIGRTPNMNCPELGAASLIEATANLALAGTVCAAD